MFREYKTNCVICQGSLSKGDDLLKGLTSVLKEKNVTCGLISGIGAVTQAHIAYFNHEQKKYEELLLKEGLEILSLRGNISLKEGNIFPHVHVVLSGRDFKAIGGHLLDDTLVYAFEYEITHLEGSPFVRKLDEDTGLFIWQE
ncbi:MAG TPA: PPC domain-containing DNA-binding protein [Dissulfurispiraceae bacterium]|nr:PPC domain-containing DNA-binding protein [Dissulfurispiraceae bacterium]